LLMGRDITNTLYIKTQVNCLHSFELSATNSRENESDTTTAYIIYLQSVA